MSQSYRPSRRELVAGLAALPVAAAVPALPRAPIPAAFRPIAAELNGKIVLASRCAEALLRECSLAGLAEPSLSYVHDIVTCARALPDAADAANYLPDRLDRYRHQLLWPLNGLCGFAELLPDRTPELSGGSRRLCGAIRQAGLDIAFQLVPRLRRLQTGNAYPAFDA